MAPTPALACRPDALTPEENRARLDLFASLRRGMIAESETDRGISWKLERTKDSLVAASELVALESRCCPFLGFRIEVRPSEPAFTLTVTGPEGTAELLRRELGA